MKPQRRVPVGEMAVFARVVEEKSFSGAARKLGISKAAVSRQIAALEDSLKTQLLNRTTRRLSLTEAGLALYGHCARIVAEAEAAQEAAANLSATPRGLLKVNAPMSFGQLHLAPAVPEFLARYPELELELALNDRYVDVIEEGFDLAVRIGQLEDSSLIARKLASDRPVLCAAPAYLEAHGEPRSPSDLENRDCLLYTYLATQNEWRFKGPKGEERVRVKGRFTANNGDALRHAALAGLGIALLPSFIVGPDVRSGALEALLPGHRPPALGIYTVYPPSRHLSPKVRAFVDFLAARFDPVPYWEPEAAG